jgi:hypothetical protein
MVRHFRLTWKTFDVIVGGVVVGVVVVVGWLAVAVVVLVVVRRLPAPYHYGTY